MAMEHHSLFFEFIPTHSDSTGIFSNFLLPRVDDGLSKS